MEIAPIENDRRNRLRRWWAAITWIPQWSRPAVIVARLHKTEKAVACSDVLAASYCYEVGGVDAPNAAALAQSLLLQFQTPATAPLAKQPVFSGLVASGLPRLRITQPTSDRPLRALVSPFGRRRRHATTIN